ncbi:unnamed protein product [Pichia kudriavzevii]
MQQNTKPESKASTHQTQQQQMLQYQDTFNTKTTGTVNSSQQQASPLNMMNAGLETSLKDKLPNKPLQKKGPKKKALSGAHAPNDIKQRQTSFESIPAKQPAENFQSPAELNTFLSSKNAVEQGGREEEEKEEDDDEIVNSENYTTVLSNLHEWSEKLKQEGKEPSAELKKYEDIISKDKSYLEYSSAIAKVMKENPHGINDKIGTNGKLFQRIFRDLKFYQQVKAARMQSMKLAPEQNGLTNYMWGDGYSGYGNGFTDDRINFIFPQNSKVPYLNEPLGEANDRIITEQPNYVPIRLEFDVDRDGFKLNDTFVWNANEDDDTLNTFVNELIRDYRIDRTVGNIHQKIVESVKDQISDVHPLVVNPALDLRFPINLDITIANNQLVDRFDWDLMNEENDPEDFAETLCAEFSLPGEFKTAIAHSIREQSQIYIKSLFMIGYKFDGSNIVSEDLKEYLRSGIEANSVIMPRYLLSDFTPYITELSIDNFERIIKERERESRRKKRGATRTGRRGGFVLPDLTSMPKTFRTPLPTGIFPGGVTINDDGERPVSEFINMPIEIGIPKEQIAKIRENDEHNKRIMKVIRRQQQKTREWIVHVRSRRMRGETLTSTVRIVDLPESGKPDISSNADVGTVSPESNPDGHSISSGAVKTEVSESLAMSSPNPKILGVVSRDSTENSAEIRNSVVPEKSLLVCFRFGWR